MLEQRLADSGDVAVAEDAKATAEEAVADAVALHVLRGEEAHERLRRGQPDGAHDAPLLDSSAAFASSAATSAATASAGPAPCCVPPRTSSTNAESCAAIASANARSESGGQRNRHSSTSFVPWTATRHMSPGGKRRPSDATASPPPESSNSASTLSGSPSTGGSTPDGRGGDGGTCQLLSREPADLVELVDAHVDEDATALGPERRRRRPLVPLLAPHEQDVAELARLDPVAQAAQRGDEPPPVPDLQRRSGLGRALEHRPSLLRRSCRTASRRALARLRRATATRSPSDASREQRRPRRRANRRRAARRRRRASRPG